MLVLSFLLKKYVFFGCYECLDVSECCIVYIGHFVACVETREGDGLVYDEW